MFSSKHRFTRNYWSIPCDVVSALLIGALNQVQLVKSLTQLDWDITDEKMAFFISI